MRVSDWQSESDLNSIHNAIFSCWGKIKLWKPRSMAEVEWIQDCNVASQIPQIDMDLVQWTTNSNTLRSIADFFFSQIALDASSDWHGPSPLGQRLIIYSYIFYTVCNIFTVVKQFFAFQLEIFTWLISLYNQRLRWLWQISGMSFSK